MINRGVSCFFLKVLLLMNKLGYQAWQNTPFLISQVKHLRHMQLALHAAWMIRISPLIHASSWTLLMIIDEVIKRNIIPHHVHTGGNAYVFSHYVFNGNVIVNLNKVITLLTFNKYFTPQPDEEVFCLFSCIWVQIVVCPNPHGISFDLPFFMFFMIVTNFSCFQWCSGWLLWMVDVVSEKPASGNKAYSCMRCAMKIMANGQMLLVSHELFIVDKHKIWCIFFNDKYQHINSQ